MDDDLGVAPILGNKPKGSMVLEYLPTCPRKIFQIMGKHTMHGAYGKRYEEKISNKYMETSDDCLTSLCT